MNRFNDLSNKLFKILGTGVFILLLIAGCSPEQEGNKLTESLEKNLFSVTVTCSAGTVPENKQDLLPAPANLIELSSCNAAVNPTINHKGLLLAEGLPNGNQVFARLVGLMEFKHRADETVLLVPVLLPHENALFKYLPDDQFRMKYDEMIAIIEQWYWNYLDYRAWSLVSWKSELLYREHIKPCFYESDNNF